MLRTFVTLGVVVVSAGGATTAGAQAPTQSEAQLEFTAGRIGGGPGHGGGSIGAPIRQLRGVATISYPSGRFASGQIVSIRVVGVTNPGARGWQRPITTATMRLLPAGARPGRASGPVVQIRGPVCQPSPCATRDAFWLNLELQVDRHAAAPLGFRGAGYTVSGDREAYQARAGTVRITRVDAG